MYGYVLTGFVSVCPDRAGGTFVRRLWSMMTSQRDGVDATVNTCTGFTYVRDIHATLFFSNL